MKKLNNIPQPKDGSIWEENIKGIKKLKQPEIPPGAEAPLIIEEVRQSVNYAEAYSGSALGSLNIGEFDNIDRRTADKFRKGEFKIERRLDLHGLTEKEAFDAVDSFIRNAYLQSLRCVLIITGKGLSRETGDWYDKKGILKECVPAWLNTPELRPLILAASYARPEDGGTGALYVLLRRRRQAVCGPIS